MKNLRKQGGFTLIELLVVILILAVLMAIALPLYLRAVKDSERQTCRSNMQTIANAEQAYRVRSAGHQYTADLTLLVGPDEDLQALPRCPSNDGMVTTDDYTVDVDPVTNQLTIKCASAEAAFHNTVDGVADVGFRPGIDSE